jgi:hypothetical protein
MKMNKIFIGLAVTAAVLTSCENQDVSYPDFEYQTVYFANQYPARTVELGEDLVMDNSIDNQHKIIIKATMGGVYANNKNIVIDFVVDTTLCSGIYFSKGATSGSKVIPMPSNYYQLASNQITIPSGSILGGVEVQLTDAFFADTLSLVNTYVIPLLMTNVQGADSILQGIPLVDNPNRCVDTDWSVKPRDFVLYAVKYVNPWHSNYLRRGKDDITEDGVAKTITRHKVYVESDDVCKLTSLSYTELTFPLDYKNKLGTNLNFNCKLAFGEDQKCTVLPKYGEYNLNDTCRVFNITATGTGQFVSKGDKNSWGGKDRDALYLDYEIGYVVEINYKKLGFMDTQTMNYKTKDTLVVRDRGVAPEYFTVIKK